jgi:YbgC/YbaW family acyl-CoA thioester hydrolase
VSERVTRLDLRVRFGETDAFGIVFYPNFFQYFDLGTEELWRQSPYDFSTGVKDGGIGFPIMETGAKFFAPLHPGDEFTVVTRVAEVRTRALRVEHEVRRGETLIATGFEVRAHARKLPGEEKLVMEAIPDELRAWLLP